jgi:5'-nucleotidase
MRVLVTNDDGIHADGLVALEAIAAALGDEVWVVAPEVEQSGASRALTLAEPLRVRRIGDRKFAVRGTPTDCVMLAMAEFLPDPPDLVLSGVNRGQNVAEDLTVSGTVAGAIQGMVLGVPSIALSQALLRDHYQRTATYDVAQAFGPDLIRRALATGWPKDVILNINFPDVAVDEVKGLRVTRQGFRDEFNVRFEKRTDLRGRDYYWTGFNREPSAPVDGTDIAAIHEGYISVTPVHINVTHDESLASLAEGLEGMTVR